jgi:hypothetical protein
MSGDRMELVVTPRTLPVTKNWVGFQVKGSVSYSPDGCVEIDVQVKSTDGKLHVVHVQAHLRDRFGTSYLSMKRYQVGSDGKVKGVPRTHFKGPVSAYHIRRAHEVFVTLSEKKIVSDSW